MASTAMEARRLHPGHIGSVIEFTDQYGTVAYWRLAGFERHASGSLVAFKKDSGNPIIMLQPNDKIVIHKY